MGSFHQLDFTPLPLLSSNHLQTTLGSFGLPVDDPPFKKELVQLEDGSRVCCIASIPDKWAESKGIIVLLHGLGGSNRSHYIRRITSKLYRLGYFVYCKNSLGCGCGKGLVPKLSHAGKTDDILFVLDRLKHAYPSAPIQVIGFSIGGNRLLKLLGEMGEDAKKYVVHGIAVCPLVNLRDAAERLGLPSNRIYQRSYVKGLIQLVRAAEAAFPNEKKVCFPPGCSIIKYDELYTAPKGGFESIQDYYAKSSSANVISRIQVPCDILCSLDDPFISIKTLEILDFPQCVKVWKTNYGGHMGFLGWNAQRNNIRWMDQTVLSWIRAVHVSCP